MARSMDRRQILQTAAGLSIAGALPPFSAHAATNARPQSRARPGDPGWPSEAEWTRLQENAGGNLIKPESPLVACVGKTSGDCARLFAELKNPFFLGDEPGLTQTLGWVGAWTSRASAYVVAAQTTADVVAAVNFARTHNLRLVVRGGAHSYLGQSIAPDSLMIWTRRMNAIALSDAFVPAGCAGKVEPRPAVTIGAGAMWGHVYAAVMAKGGRYVQGGGCMTVGVAGFLNGGGFGSLSKRYGLGAASLIEAEVVTADGEVRIANSCTNPDLLWALKGGGAGFGVVTRLTLATHELPETVGGVFASVRAKSDNAWRRLIERVIGFYAEALFNEHWGEQLRFSAAKTLGVFVVFQSLSQAEAEAIWRPFFDWIAAAPADFEIVAKPQALAASGRAFWDPTALSRIPGLVVRDGRPGAPEDNILWAGDQGEAGQTVYAYQSVWLPATLLDPQSRGLLAEALIEATKNASVSLHVNKGLAGGRPDGIAAAKETAINPAATDAFALAISAATGAPSWPGIPGHEPDEAAERTRAAAVSAGMDNLRKLQPRPASYAWETDSFEPNWQEAFWGDNYARLRAVKATYDADGLFTHHHAVGSEDWSADGFMRLK